MPSRDLVTPHRFKMALPVSLFVLFAACSFQFIVDDSYIVHRYAINFLRFGVISYNISDHVNALTSPLEFFILTGFVKFFGGQGFFSYRLFCLLLFVASSLFASIRLFDRDSLRFAYLSISLCSPFAVIWALGGLETCLLGSLSSGVHQSHGQTAI
jgi:hypothetical protein